MTPFYLQGYFTASLMLPPHLNPWIWWPAASAEYMRGYSAGVLTLSLGEPRGMPRLRLIQGGRRGG